MWAGTDDGNVQLTKDGGKTWVNFRGKIPGMPVGAWVPQIRASRYHAAEAFVVCNDYRRGDFKPYIFRTKNFGQTWELMVSESKVKGYALCMIQDPVEPNLIFAGTEQGLWVSFDNGAAFEQWKNGYPSVSTYDFAIQEREADLCIATFGRALYVMDDIRPLRKFAAGGGKTTTKKLTVFESPVAWQAQVKHKAGYDYSTWGLYDGQNRSRGAAYSFYVKPPEKADTSKSKSDSVSVRIYNGQNELVRSLKVKADTGFNRNYWGFETRGIRQPGSLKPKPNTPEPPTGMPAFPGTYKIVLSMGKDVDSTMLIVKSDPALNVVKEIYDAKQAAIKRLEKNVDKIVEATDRLTDADETIAKIDAQLKNVEGAAADSLRKSGKSMTDSIKKVRNFIMGTPQEKQGYGTPYEITVSERLREARSEIMRKNKIPDAQEFGLIEMAESLLNAALQKANNFFSGPWKKYQQQAEATPMKFLESSNHWSK